MTYHPFLDPTSRQLALLQAIGVSRAETVPIAPIENPDAAEIDGVQAGAQLPVAT
jgi:hypothetical protein